VLKSIEIDMEKLHMKFSALNVDFNGPSLDFLGSRKPAHKGIKELYPCKSCYFTIVSQSFIKTAGSLRPETAIVFRRSRELQLKFPVLEWQLTALANTVLCTGSFPPAFVYFLKMGQNL